MSAEPSDPRASWDAEAATFDDEPDHGLRDPATREAWRALLSRHLPAPPADVLDLGCGTGTLTVLLAQDGHRVHGVDWSPAMVAAARTKIADAGVAATAEQGDAAHPAGAPAAYDVVLSRHVLWALPDPAGVVGRWTQLARPGGRLVLIEGWWWTGGGLTATQTRRLVEPHLAQVVVEPLTDPLLWGGPISDERYLLTGRTLG
jgi:SAM-dependent methyltransferase